MIEARDLRKEYKPKKGAMVKALDGVSLKLPDTGMVFILGKSGSGKSTLLNVLGGLDSIDSGEIIIKGTSAKKFKQSHYDSYRNTYIGFIFQEYNILEELTVGANVALAIELQGRKATNEEINSILCEVDLDGYGGRKPNELSGGQKQRVAIARALVKKPEIIMADEPTGALDSNTGKQVFDTLKKLSKSKLVLIVSHDRDFSEQYADRIIELKDGQIISDVEKTEDNASDGASVYEENLTYEGASITVKQGYTLTEEDRIQINEYLRALSTGATINVSDKKAKKVGSDEFKPTDESKIVSNKKGDFKLIKSKLSVKNAFKLGSGGLKHKKFRLIFTIFLSFISFTLFGLADTIAAYDKIGTATSSIYDTGVNYASYIKNVKYNYGDGDFYWQTGFWLSEEDIKTISEKTGTHITGVYNKNMNLSVSSYLGGLSKDDDKNYRAIFDDSFSGFASLSEELMNEHSFTLLGAGAHIPEKGKNEIVITKFMYDYFALDGFVHFTKEGNETVEVKSPDDLIGKPITLDLGYSSDKYLGTQEFIISGVIDTHFDYSRYMELSNPNVENTMNFIELMALTSELDSARDYSFACVAFVNPEVIEKLVSTDKNAPDSFKGSANLYIVKDDNIEYEHELFGEENLIISHYNTNYLSSLLKSRDDIVWFGDPKTALNDNQVIIPFSALMSLQGGSNYEYNKFWEPASLHGFESTIYTKMQEGSIWLNTYFNGLYEIVNNYVYFANVKYAYENPAAARAAIIDVYVEQYGQNRDDAKIEEANLYNEYANLVMNGIIKPESRAYEEEYLESLAKGYNIGDYILPKSVRDSLVTTIEYNGRIFDSYNKGNLALVDSVTSNLENIINYKYAFENVGEVERFALALGRTEEDLKHFNFSDLAWEYIAGHIRGENKDVDFESQATVDYKTFYKNQISSLSASFSDDGRKMILCLQNYMVNYQNMQKNVEIVGVTIDVGTNSKGSNFIILSDSLSLKLLGANANGIYNFAVGSMPGDYSGIKHHVEFAKTYEKDDIRYQLKNNVTEQLDMVEKILEVLGEVFLYVGIGFAVFASMMLSNFIGTSISHKKQDIGILRAIGSRSNDVFRIFFAESFIIAMINYVLSVAGTLTVSFVINKILREDAGLLITFLNFGLRQIVLLLLVSLLVAFVATFIPVKKIASLKPIDAIKNRK